MRSMKLLVAAALVAALVAGPVMAQDAMTGAPATETTKPVKHHKKHTGKKHSHKKATAAPAPEATPAQ